MTAVATLLDEAAARLKRAGIESPRLEARLLLEHATGITRERMLMCGHDDVGVVEAQAFRELVARRAAREPLAYIRGHAEFWGLDLAVSEGVLIPRADTETLIEVARLAFPDETTALRILDLGVGSGCLLLTLLHLYPSAAGLGTDTSEAALRCARENAARLGVLGRVGLRRTAWGEGVEGPFDLILSNPPYIPTTEIDGLQPEVARFEPRAALDGGPDGLAIYRALTGDLMRLLAPEGVALLEIGRGQDGPLAPWFKSHGFTVRGWRDLAGITRCLELRRQTARTSHPSSPAR